MLISIQLIDMSSTLSEKQPAKWHPPQRSEACFAGGPDRPDEAEHRGPEEYFFGEHQVSDGVRLADTLFIYNPPMIVAKVLA
jgi:hypothetical protein